MTRTPVVDNIGSDACARRVIEDVALSTELAVREAVQAGRGVGLHDGLAGRDPVVALNVGDLVSVVDLRDHEVIGVEGHGAPLVHLEGVDLGGQRVALETSLVQVALLDGGGEVRLLGIDGIVVEGAVVDNNVAVGDEVVGPSVDDGQARDAGAALATVDDIRRQGSHERRQGEEDGQKRGRHGEC